MFFVFHWWCFAYVALVLLCLYFTSFVLHVFIHLFQLCCFVYVYTGVLFSVSLLLFCLCFTSGFFICFTGDVLSMFHWCCFVYVARVLFCLCFTGDVLCMFYWCCFVHSDWELMWSSFLLEGEIAEQRYISLCNYTYNSLFYNKKMILDMFHLFFL